MEATTATTAVAANQEEIKTGGKNNQLIGYRIGREGDY